MMINMYKPISTLNDNLSVCLFTQLNIEVPLKLTANFLILDCKKCVTEVKCVTKGISKLCRYGSVYWILDLPSYVTYKKYISTDSDLYLIAFKETLLWLPIYKDISRRQFSYLHWPENECCWFPSLNALSDFLINYVISHICTGICRIRLNWNSSDTKFWKFWKCWKRVIR